jgi:hypothetical protein
VPDVSFKKHHFDVVPVAMLHHYSKILAIMLTAALKNFFFLDT